MTETNVISPADALRKSFNEPNGWGRWPIMVAPAEGYLALICAELNGPHEDVNIRLHGRGDKLAHDGKLKRDWMQVIFQDGRYCSFEVKSATDWADLGRQLREQNLHPVYRGLADLFEKVGRGEDLRAIQYMDE